MVSMMLRSSVATFLILALLGSAVEAASVDRQRRCMSWIGAAIQRILPQEEDSDLVKYRQEFLGSLDTPAEESRKLDSAQLDERLAAARLVLLGDQHGTAAFQQNAQEVIEKMARGAGPLHLVIEFIDARFQQHLDDYQAGRLAEAEFKKQAYDGSEWGFPWRSFRAILATARDHGVRVIAGEPGRGLSLRQRDRGIAEKVRALDGRALVFYGSLHILGDEHLSGLLEEDLILVSIGDDTYWKLAGRFGPDFGNVELRPGLLFQDLADPIAMEWPELEFMMESFGYSDVDDLVRIHPDLGSCPCETP